MSTQDDLPVKSFDESIGLDDEKPFPTWQPSPRQIREFGRQIRSENFEARRDVESCQAVPGG